MIVNEDIFKELCQSAGEERKQNAQDFVRQRKVNIKKVIYEDENNFEIRSSVRDIDGVYDIHVQLALGEIQDLSCTCEDYNNHYATCKHILASVIEFNNNENYVRIFLGDKEDKQIDKAIYSKTQKKNEKYREFKQLLHEFYPNYEEINKTIKIKKYYTM